ncbi:host cell factor-like [Diorhabda carinulata]|uniref:host cell factor-like n=1 Tax=Diorhabda carinulata TaxID=1163345 RepID=UPI0025A07E22|nr:host cell factor-like [Diorhabda carinulata]
MELEEGASYKFRLAAANLNGQGEWSEELLVKSRKIGLPAAPVVYDFVLTKFGACLSWETSSADDRDNVEYSLYLGVKRKKREKTHKMKFKIVYCGHENRCFIRNAVLSGARIDTTHSPALIFRLLVKGDNGIGSVNQIRCSNVQTCVNNKTIQQLLREQL